MGRNATVAGISDHNGWAIFVSVSIQGGEPVITDRRRVELVDAALPKQPYEHETRELSRSGAEQLVREVRESAAVCAERTLAGLGVAAIAIRDAPLKAMPTVAEAHASSWVNARADAMLYHQALCGAASTLGLAVHTMPRGEERPRAAQAMKLSVEALDEWLEGLRARLGAPWQKDHRDAAARAITALGSP